MPEPYQHPSTFALPCAAASPFIATAQSKVLLKAAPNFATNCSLVHMVSLSLLELHENTSEPVITLADWDTKNYGAMMSTTLILIAALMVPLRLQVR